MNDSSLLEVIPNPATALASDVSPSVISNDVPSRQQRPRRQVQLSGSEGPFRSAANPRRRWGFIFGTSAAVAYEFVFGHLSRAHV